MNNTLVYLIQNAYNAPWPKDFHASSFSGGYSLDITISSFSEITLLTKEDLKALAQDLILSNVHLHGTSFYTHYLQPIANTINFKPHDLERTTL